ncbi:MAG: tetratricopeptide repeat protein [Bacteroidota bacterium]
MKTSLLRVCLVISFSLSGCLLYSQGADSLYRKFLISTQLEDPIEQDTLTIKDYAAYAIWQLNERVAFSEALLDSMDLYSGVSSWPKAFGINMRVKARFFELNGDMDQGLNFYNLAVDSLRNADPPYNDLSTALIGSGFILLHSGLYEEAMETFQEANGFAKQSGEIRNQLKMLDFFGDYYYYSAFGQQKFDSASKYYLLAQDFIKEHGFYGYFESDNYHGLANVYRRLGMVDSSEKYFQKSLDLAKQANNYGVIYALYIDKAEPLEEQGKYAQALKLKEEAYEYVQASGFIEFIARADQQLYQTYKAVGDYKNALHYYEKYNIAQDSMKKDAAAGRYAELEARFDSKEKEEEIIRLQNENLQQARDYLFWILILGVVLIAFISWLNLRLRRKNDELEKKNEEILLAQLKGQTLERKRMATELHDNLNTKIAAIRWQLEAVSPSVNEKSQKILNKTLELVNDVYGDVRFISHNLMPEKVEEVGMVPALENLLGQLNQNNKVQFNLVVNTQPGFDFGSLSYHIYNIILEIINNILKHAEAENGWISISEDDEIILITVSDDGKGFDINEASNGYGIRNITSRLENIKGKWNIESAIGEGTKFFMEIPRL